MPSTLTIYSSQIDINYPQVGIDNDTQGFRNNFYNIQASFLVAGIEISNLIDNGVKLFNDNDFNNNKIQNAVLKNTSQSASGSLSINTGSSYNTIDYKIANYHKVSIAFTGTNTYHSFNITNWPSNNYYGNLFLHVTPNNISSTTFNIVGSVTLLGPNNFPRTYNQTKPVIYEVWSTDNGSTIYAIELTSY